MTGRTGGAGAITLTGTVSQPALVTVNGSSVQVKANQFSATVPVTAGTNDIPITATNPSHTDKSTSKIARLVVSGSGSQAYTYDLNGNLLSDGTRSFTWDARNRLTSIIAGSSTTSFAYDGQDRRVSIVETSGALTTTKKLVWVGNSIAEEHDANDTVTKRYYNQGMQVVSVTNTANYFYTADHLGSIRELTSSNGAVQTRYDYDPYGRQTTIRVSGTDNTDADFGFTGHYFHAPSELNLTLYRAYDAETARWISRDPLGEAGGLNLYGYVENNPVNDSDRLGLFGDGRSGPRGNPNNPLGHSDFTGNDRFDYTAEDHDWRTRPEDPFFGNPEGHFQDLTQSLQEARAAIETCDRGAFGRAMHRAQDYYSHYAKGYRFNRSRLQLGHLFAKTNPDDDANAWLQAEIMTQGLLEEWNKKCEKCKKQ